MDQLTTVFRAPGVAQAAAPAGRARPRLRGFAAILPGILWMLGCLSGFPQAASGPLSAGKSAPGGVPPAGASGPTLHLDYGRGSPAGDPASEFMYFVALISPEPVSVVKSPGNTQRVRMLAAARSFTAKSFSLSCEFEFSGQGSQRSVFDHSEIIRRHEARLKKGGSLDNQLGSINVEGAGTVGMEVEGTISGGATNVTEVRLRFKGRGAGSLVTIDLADIAYSEGAFRPRNEKVVRVKTLTFRRLPGRPKMEITVGSVRAKGAGDTFWNGLIGGIKGTAANLLIKPVPVEAAGNLAMLNFGHAVLSEAPAFTFPRARNLKPGGG